MDCSLPGSSVHGILQARILECVAIPFSRDLPHPEIEPGCPTSQADFFTVWASREAIQNRQKESLLPMQKVSQQFHFPLDIIESLQKQI